MNQVVNFLSLQAVTEEQGSIKRMLSVCTEFERIARVVLEKADKETSRRRRRPSKQTNTLEPDNPQHIPQKRAAPPTPQPSNAQTPQNVFYPGFTGDLNAPFNPSLSGFSPSFNDLNLPIDFNTPPTTNEFSSLMPDGMNFIPQQDMGQFQTDGNAPLNTGSFQQPFVSQDLWQMPMTLEWDWAEMAGVNGVEGYEEGGQG